MLWVRRLWIALVLGLGSTAVARASNGVAPRIPADFGRVPCMLVVDRSVDPVLHVPYSVARDDVGVTEDEVADSRRHQFFAFGQGVRDLPSWISRGDVARAAALDLVDAEAVPAREVLEESPDWPAGTWARLGPDDARVPITAEQAAMGVDFDTRAVAAGTWLLAGYTWEPPINLWSMRLGAIKVVDGPDAVEVGPALYLEPGVDVAYANEAYPIRGCVEAMPGSTIELAYVVTGSGKSAPVTFAHGLTGVDGVLEADFVAPAALAGPSVLVHFRGRIRDPLGRLYDAWLPHSVAVLGAGTGEGTAGEDGGSGFDPDGEDRDRPGTLSSCRIARPAGLWGPTPVLVALGLRGRRPRRRPGSVSN